MKNKLLTTLSIYLLSLSLLCASFSVPVFASDDKSKETLLQQLPYLGAEPSKTNMSVEQARAYIEILSTQAENDIKHLLHAKHLNRLYAYLLDYGTDGIPILLVAGDNISPITDVDAPNTIDGLWVGDIQTRKPDKHYNGNWIIYEYYDGTIHKMTARDIAKQISQNRLVATREYLEANEPTSNFTFPFNISTYPYEGQTYLTFGLNYRCYSDLSYFGYLGMFRTEDGKLVKKHDATDYKGLMIDEATIKKDRLHKKNSIFYKLEIDKKDQKGSDAEFTPLFVLEEYLVNSAYQFPASTQQVSPKELSNILTDLLPHLQAPVKTNSVLTRLGNFLYQFLGFFSS